MDHPYEDYENVIKPYAGKMYERIANMHHLQDGTEQQQELYRRANEIVNGIAANKDKAA